MGHVHGEHQARFYETSMNNNGPPPGSGERHHCVACGHDTSTGQTVEIAGYQLPVCGFPCNRTALANPATALSNAGIILLDV